MSLRNKYWQSHLTFLYPPKIKILKNMKSFKSNLLNKFPEKKMETESFNFEDFKI